MEEKKGKKIYKIALTSSNQEPTLPVLTRRYISHFHPISPYNLSPDFTRFSYVAAAVPRINRSKPVNNEWRERTTQRERERKEREKKDIASRWTRRLAFTVSEASLAANGERGFRPCVERRWERAEWRDRERERAAIGHGRSI